MHRLTGITGIVASEGYPLPAVLAGVTLTIGGVPAPLLAVADLGTYQQINFQVPRAVQGTSYSGAISQNGSSKPVAFSGTAWSLFFTDGDGYVVAEHASDYSRVTSANPARPGEWILLFGTNAGALENPPPDGTPAPVDPLSTLNNADRSGFYVTLRPSASQISDWRIGSDYVGLAPGMVGVFQINVQIPVDYRVGPTELFIDQFRMCGFFWTEGCGRGWSLQRRSTIVKLMM